MTRRAAVIGLDGAAWHLLDPLIEAGAMPRLGALRDRGASGTLRSTVPTYTPPAWTSAITGVNPGRHGIYGFVMGNAQSQPKALAHVGRIQVATLWEMANAQGARAGMFHVPLTYPPQELDGWMVSGMMTPGYGERMKGFATPAELEGRILEWTPGYVIDVSANWEQDWRDHALCDRVIASLDQRITVLQRLLDDEPPEVLFAVLESPDRLQHVYYRYLDAADPLYRTPEAESLRPHITDCFRKMDDLVGLVDDFAGAAGGVIVCSDHGFTGWDVSVHTNALLERWGYLKVKGAARAMQTEVARKLVPVARKLLSAKVARQAKGKTFAAIDWAKTRAFASPIPQQGIFVNVEGREPDGIVPPSELEAIKTDLVARFEGLRGPDGDPVTDVVYRSEEVFHGGALAGAPDVLPVLRDHRYELDDEIFHREAFTDHSHLPRGVHHPDGIVVVAGEGVAAGGTVDGSVLDVTPTLLYMAGLNPPESLDGVVLTGAFSDEHLREHPIGSVAALSSGKRDESSPYSEAEEAAIEESLRGLGYL
ncbi:MAG: alkaline phosphatase family protein [Actinomycetota bacterium]|nr:alkaline phosphatase family protein [Actinomycetota bacterium]